MASGTGSRSRIKPPDSLLLDWTLSNQYHLSICFLKIKKKKIKLKENYKKQNVNVMKGEEM